MSGASLVYIWEPRPWLFSEILSPSLIMLTLFLPFAIAFTKQFLERGLSNFGDTIFNCYSFFFFIDNGAPKSFFSKVVMFFFSLYVLVFLSFYLGTLTDEYNGYKNFDGISSIEDIYNRKMQVSDELTYMLLAIGGTKDSGPFAGMLVWLGNFFVFWFQRVFWNKQPSV